MVLAKRYERRRIEEELKKRDAEWADWMQRRDAAMSQGRDFTEPSPAEKKSNR